MTEVVEVLVEGGQASAGPPIGPALGPHGVNIMDVVNEINEETEDFQDTTVPVKIYIEPTTKEYEIEVGTPPASSLILKRAGVDTGSSNPRLEKAGSISMQDVVDIAKMKETGLLGKSMKEKAKEVVGTCGSMGIEVDGKDPKEIGKDIDEGDYDSFFD